MLIKGREIHLITEILTLILHLLKWLNSHSDDLISMSSTYQGIAPQYIDQYTTLIQFNTNTEEELKKKSKYYDVKQDCLICYDVYHLHENIRILPCQHYFHQNCIDKWLIRGKKDCIICQQSIDSAIDHNNKKNQ